MVQKIRNQVICADGFKISIQASSGHYCTPRIDTEDDTKYTSVEVMVEQWDDLLNKYAEKVEYCPCCKGHYDINEPIGELPGKILLKLLKKHGGAIQGEIPPLDIKE